MKSIVTSITKTLFPGSLPIKRILLLCCIWFVIAGLNYTKIKYSGNFGTPVAFPFSVFWIQFKFSGLKYGLLYFLFYYLTIKFKLYYKFINVYFISIILIILANLSLGTFEDAFIRPISGSGYEYFHDAIKINEWHIWLNDFNKNQENLLCHSRTHPPGAVLFHNLLFTVSSSPLWISGFILFISSLSILSIKKIFIELGNSNVFSNKMALLFSLIPAVNIYSLACIDAVIALFINFTVLGLIIINKSSNIGRLVKWTILIGFFLTFTSLLTFGVLFIWAVFGLMSFYTLYKYKSFKLLKSLLLSLFIFIFSIVLLFYFYEFSYVESFLTASKLENQQGFMLFSYPLEYIGTRIENVLEIVIFLSLPIVPLLSKNKINFKEYDTILSFTALLVLILMFVSGAYKTGETARACLFIVSFILIQLKGISQNKLTSLISFAAIQTIVMQLMGNYLW